MQNNDLNKVAVTENDLAEAKETLGDSVNDMSDDQLRKLVADMKYLTGVWFEEYERSVFDGKTLNEKLSGL